ncbi:MAG TPA: cellulose biosynthesis protein BcsO [Klebsiella sp.]|jgi:hypothetical protein
MNHYDDLQRFKEKTRTHSLKFRDLSSEAASDEKGDWAILNQLIPAEEESSLAIGGSVSLPLPQRVPADMFHKVERAIVQTTPASSSVTPALTVPEAVASSAPQPIPVRDSAAAVAVASAPQTAVPQPVHQAAVPQPIPALAPVARPRPAIAPTAEGFAHLFAAKTVEPVAKDKDQSLKSLLERIATCR